jgi:hypothetical protein
MRNGDLRNGGAPASPDGDVFFPNNIPTGSKNTPIVSLNGRNAHRGSGPIAIPIRNRLQRNALHRDGGGKKEIARRINFISSEFDMLL